MEKFTHKGEGVEQKESKTPSVSSLIKPAKTKKYAWETSRKSRKNAFGESYGYYGYYGGGYSSSYWDDYEDDCVYSGTTYFSRGKGWGRYGTGSSLLSNYNTFNNYSDLKDERDILKKGISKVRELITILNIPKKVFIRVSPLIKEDKDAAEKADRDAEFCGEEVKKKTTVSSWCSGLFDTRTRYYSSDRLQGIDFNPDCNSDDYVSLYLHTKVLEDKTKLTQDKINIITAEGIHECSHILFTHSRTLNDFLIALPKILHKRYMSLSGIKPELRSVLVEATELFNMSSGTDLDNYTTVAKNNFRVAAGNYYKSIGVTVPYSKSGIDNLYRQQLQFVKEVCQLIFTFANIIEDSRAEEGLIYERPGVSEHLEILREYRAGDVNELLEDSLFDPCINHKGNTTDSCPEILANVILTLMGKKDKVTSNFPMKDEIEAVLRPSNSTIDSCKIAVDVFKVIDNWSMETFGVPFQNILYCPDDYFKNEAEGTPMNGLDKLTGKFASGSSTLADNGDSGKGEIDGVNINNSLSDPREALSDFYASLANSQVASTLTSRGKDLINGELNDIIESQKAIDDGNVYFYEVNGEPGECSTGVANMKNRAKLVSSYASVLKKSILGKFKNQKFKYYGCKSGTLDPAKIVEAYQGVENVYTQPAEYVTSKIVLTLLLDESGSMGDSDGCKVDLVKKAATLLISAFGNSEYVDLYIYGHTADVAAVGDTDILIYKEGSKKSDKTMVDLKKISYAKGRVENRDGVAIYEVAKRVDKMAYGALDKGNKEKKSIMVVMSDGTPCAYKYHYTEGVADTKEKVEKVKEEFGTQVIQCTVEEVRDSEKMFDTVIKLEDDLPNFVSNITRVINDLLEKNITTKIVRY